MSSDGTEDKTAAVHGALHSADSSASAPSCVAESRCSHSSVFSSPVSDLALNLEVLSTDGFSSQGSSSTDG